MAPVTAIVVMHLVVSTYYLLRWHPVVDRVGSLLRLGNGWHQGNLHWLGEAGVASAVTNVVDRPADEHVVSS